MADVRWSGLDELLRDLQNLPTDLAGDAGHIVEAAGHAAAVTVRSEYGRHALTGHLQDSVRVEQVAAGPYGAAVRVKSTDPIAWIFDHGSQARHYVTIRGVQHATGQMWGRRPPPPHVFTRTVIRERRSMYGKLRDLLRRHGATTVEGEP